MENRDYSDYINNAKGRTMDKQELDQIIEKHGKWLRGEIAIDLEPAKPTKAENTRAARP